MITHVVQAQSCEYWADVRTATSLEQAQRLEIELLADDNAWMPCHHGKNAIPRLTRIVGVEASNCANRYNAA